MSQRDVRVARVVAHPARIISANILCLRSRCWLLDTRDDAVPLDNSADFRRSLSAAVGAGCAVSACAKALGTQAGRLHRDARPPALAGAALCGVHRTSSIVEVSERACAGHEARNDLMRAALHGAMKKRRAGGRHSPTSCLRADGFVIEADGIRRRADDRSRREELRPSKPGDSGRCNAAGSHLPRGGIR